MGSKGMGARTDSVENTGNGMFLTGLVVIGSKSPAPGKKTNRQPQGASFLSPKPSS